MIRRCLVWLFVGSLFLGSCTDAPTPTPTARIVAFTASLARVPRGEPVTLTWQAADVGVQDGLFSCVTARRFGDEPAWATLQATCAGSLADVPAAPLSADTVHYRFEILKQPYDPNDPYLARTHAVVLDPARFALRVGDNANDRAVAVTPTTDGGAIVVGEFEGTATFGATVLTSPGTPAAFVARVEPDGTWRWARAIAGSGAVRARSVTGVADGGAIVVGVFADTVGIGGTPLVSAGGDDVFVARIDGDGTWAWARRGGGTASVSAAAATSLDDGGAILVGHFTGPTTFGATTLLTSGGSDVFVARIGPTGTWAWARRGGGSDVDVAHSATTLADGGVLVAGSYVADATFGTTTLDAAGDWDAFVARIEPDGTWAWARRLGNAGPDVALAVNALADGGAVATGYFAETVAFGATTLSSVGSNDVFVARLDPAGAWTWAQRAGGPDLDGGEAVSTLADGSTIVTGYFTGTATFGATTLTSTVGRTAFVARIGDDGGWSWARTVGAPGPSRAGGVVALDDGGAIVVGDFSTALALGGTTLTNAGLLDAFVARIGAGGAW